MVPDIASHESKRQDTRKTFGIEDGGRVALPVVEISI